MAKLEPLPGVRWRPDRECWEAAAVVSYDANGNPAKRITKRFKALEDANEWKAEQDKKKRHGTLTDDAVLTLGEWCKEWLEGKKAKKLEDKTISSYEWIVQKWIVPQLGGFRLSDLTPRHINRYLTQLQNETTQDSAYRARRHLVMILDDACDLELLHRNPVKKVKLDKPKTKPAARWTREEAAQMLEHCLKPTTTNRLRHYVVLALIFAHRREEMLGMRHTDIVWEQNKIKVEQVCVFVGGKAILKPTPKNESSRRELFVDDFTLEILKLQLSDVEFQRQFAQASGRKWQENNLVFPSRVGTPMPEGRLRLEFISLCKEAGVPVIQVRRTRATYNSVVSLDLRAPPKLVADRMGHSDEQTQVKFYQSVSDDQRRSMALGLAELYGFDPAKTEPKANPKPRDEKGLN